MHGNDEVGQPPEEGNKGEYASEPEVVFDAVCKTRKVSEMITVGQRSMYFCTLVIRWPCSVPANKPHGKGRDTS